MRQYFAHKQLFPSHHPDCGIVVGRVVMPSTPIHESTICKRDVADTQYVGKGYRSKFVCGICNRSTWQHLGFLGQRNVMCNGLKFTKEPKS